MDMQNLVAQEGKSLEGIERRELEAANIEMFAYGGPRTFEGGQGIVCEQELEARIVVGAAFAVEIAKGIQPEFATGA